MRHFFKRTVSCIAAISVITSSLFAALNIIASGQGQNAVEVMNPAPLSVSGVGGQRAEKKEINLFDKVYVAGVGADSLISNDEANVSRSSNALVMGGFSLPLTYVTHLLFYVKVPSANVLAPTIGLDVNYFPYSYTPSLSLTVNAEYQVMPKNGTVWETRRTVSAQENNDLHGGIKFDSAFEGYVKIPLDVFSIEGYHGFIIINEIDKLNSVACRFAKSGGEYGEMEFGFFPVTGNCDSNIIRFAESPEEPDPEPEKPDNRPVKVKSIENSATGRINVTSEDEALKLGFGDFTGKKIGSGTLYEIEPEKTASSNRILTQTFEKQSASGSTGLLFYVKIPAACSISPTFNVTDPGDKSRWKYSWLPELSLSVGETVKLLKIGDTAWKSFTVAAGHTSSYKGRIDFDGPFEGFVSIPYSALKNDSGFKFDTEKDTLDSMAFRHSKIGGEFGSIIYSQMFFTMNNAGGTEIKIYGSDKLVITTETFEGEPIGLAGLKVTETADGNYELSTDSPHSFEAGETAKKNKNLLQLKSPAKKVVDSTGMMLYVKVPAATVVSVTASVCDPGDKKRWKYSWLPELSLVVGQPYNIRSANSEEWKSRTVGVACDGNNYKGGLYFDGAFEGYIKIPYSTFANDSGFKYNPEIDAFSDIAFRLQKLGGEFGNMTIGKVQLVTSEYIDGEDGPICPETEPAKQIKWILANSKAGNIKANYYMVGDSTRYVLGGVIFRKLKYVFENEYNIDCYRQARSGLKAEYWSGHTPDLEGQAGNPTVDELIAMIPEDGTNCIVDISLGINDTGSHSGADSAAYVEEGIAKIKAAKPNAVIVFTSPNLVKGKTWQAKLDEQCKIISSNPNYWYIDVKGEALPCWISDYYADRIHPNVLGQRQIFAYILSKYCPQYAYTPIDYDNIDSRALSLPDGAVLLENSFDDNSRNVETNALKLTVGGKTVPALSIKGKSDMSCEYVYDTKAYAWFYNITPKITGYEYILLHIDLPEANVLGLTTNSNNGKTEHILQGGVKYYLMSDGSSEWQEKTTALGRKDNPIYGAMEFNSAFSGWLKIPIKNFYNAPATSVEFDNMVIRFAKTSQSSEEIKIGAFAGSNDAPYIAKNVWKKSDLPEMTPFTEIVGTMKYSKISMISVPSPIPSLSDKRATIIECPQGIDLGPVDVHKSVFWACTQYDMPVGDFSHLCIYVKAPKNKDTYLMISLFDQNRQEFKLVANVPYQLMQLGSTKWEHCFATEGPTSNYGGILFQAGFEGLFKLPISSLTGARNIKDTTKIADITYRFSYLGTDEDQALVGPVFGVTKDNDTGPDEVVLTGLPAHTTARYIYQPDDGDIFTDKVMLYWQGISDAVSYKLTAYKIEETETGFAYRQASTAESWITSGAVAGLTPDTKYAIVLTARDGTKNDIATYEYITVTTLREDTVTFMGGESKLVLDKVIYPGGGTVGKAENASHLWLILLISLGGVLLAGGGCTFFIAARKRRAKK